MRVNVHNATLLGLRSAALFLATFTLIGLVGELRGRTIDVSLWWVDLEDLPSVLRLALLATLAALLAGWALHPAPGRRLRWATAIGCGLFAGFAVRDVVGFYAAAAAGRIHPAIDVPLSMFIAALLVGLALAGLRQPSRGAVNGPRAKLALALAVGAWGVVFPLAQMLFFGSTDYRRPADVAVIFGAGMTPSGAPSPLLADRIQTGVDLYRSGLVPRLIMSGSTDSNGFNEALVMRDVAVAAGVDPAAIIVDPAGNSTESTVANVAALLSSNGSNPNGSNAGSERVIAVSQAFHLPRVQLAFGQAGIDVLTVPAIDPEQVRGTPTLIAREIPAFWAYFLGICLG
jgi:vancomycin permeability regulator SanA